MNDVITPEQTAAEADSAQAGIRMNPETLEALKGSIAKWEAITAGTGYDNGAANCPLCRLFADPEGSGEVYCARCPVMKRTGKEQCANTPYYTYRRLRTTEAAQEEVDFLKSLLPQEAAT